LAAHPTLEHVGLLTTWPVEQADNDAVVDTLFAATGVACAYAPSRAGGCAPAARRARLRFAAVPGGWRLSWRCARGASAAAAAGLRRTLSSHTAPWRLHGWGARSRCCHFGGAPLQRRNPAQAARASAIHANCCILSLAPRLGRCVTRRRCPIRRSKGAPSALSWLAFAGGAHLRAAPLLPRHRPASGGPATAQHVAADTSSRGGCSADAT
jgi:hypothetical protein